MSTFRGDFLAGLSNLTNLQNNDGQAVLTDLMTSSKCVLFIGSGLSWNNYGKWHEIVNTVRASCGLPEQLPESATANQLLDGAQEARNKDYSAYLQSLGRWFGTVRGDNHLYTELLRIPSIKAYVTLNLDPLLAIRARQPEHKCEIFSYPDLGTPERGRIPVYYLHGLIDEEPTPATDKIIFSRSEYDLAYPNNGKGESPVTRLLKGFLEHENICFIGCGLREPAWPQLSAECAALRKQFHADKSKQRIILLPKPHKLQCEDDRNLAHDKSSADAQWSDNEAYYQQLGLIVVPYDPEDNYHNGLRKRLKPFWQNWPQSVRPAEKVEVPHDVTA
ncbi:MAG: SIR2 family protein [Phycisphaeraceae bacterium]|nr:SIR2 family protein [Phycisphaeraceae bacterium]